MCIKKATTNRSQFGVAGRWLDPLLFSQTIREANHFGGWRETPSILGTRWFDQWWPIAIGALLEVSYNAFGNITHRINSTDHVLLADHYIVEQAL